nr:sulfhydryl oxidase 1-like [Onthophagus taurus]
MSSLTKSFLVFSVLIVVIFNIKSSQCASLTLKEQEKYKSLIEGQGLYTTDDDVHVLTASNFNGELYGQKNAWFIEFYNSWCGFCQRYAPLWKSLGSDTRNWKDMVKIGAIDCSNEDNSPICREFEIMSFPTLRYFHEDYEQGKYGVGVSKGEDMAQQKRHLVNQIITDVLEGRGKQYRGLKPYNQTNLNELYADIKDNNAKYGILIFDKDDSLTGAEVALDLQSVKEIIVRFTYPNNSALIKFAQIEIFPSMIVMDSEKNTQKFADGLKSRESMKMAIRQFMERKMIEIPPVEEEEEKKKSEIFTGKWLESEVPDSIALLEAYEKRALKEKIKKMKDVVFQMDLETALRWSLKREVSRVKVIENEKRTALINYLDVIIKYFPLGKNAKQFLNDLKQKIVSTTSIEGKEISNIIKSAETEINPLFSSSENWLGCEGSSPEHRGYPCGLWKMFHFLTVNAAELSTEKDKPLEVLLAMEGYIKNFFGCHDCAQHFLEMTVKKNMRQVESLDSAIIWLWMAHNDANKRLAGDDTEDPQYPKVQFPSSENCPTCRYTNGSWNLVEVLKYLKVMYGGVHVRYIGSDSRVLHAGLEGNLEENFHDKSSSNLAALKGLDTKSEVKMDELKLFETSTSYYEKRMRGLK